MAQAKPDAVFVAAGKVGGIRANATYPADFLADNIAIALNTIDAAHRCAVKKLVYLGSSCIYPRLAPQPMSPEMLLTGPLEPTNQWYAIAKIAGIKLCEAYRLQHGADFVSVMPTNLYGPGDNYHPDDSHVPAALLRRFHEAKIKDDASVSRLGHRLAAARIPGRRRFGRCLRVRHEVLFRSAIPQHRDRRRPDHRRVCPHRRRRRRLSRQDQFDTSQPDGAPRKLLDVSRINALGWRATTPLREGLHACMPIFVERYDAIRDERNDNPRIDDVVNASAISR